MPLPVNPYKNLAPSTNNEAGGLSSFFSGGFDFLDSAVGTYSKLVDAGLVKPRYTPRNDSQGDENPNQETEGATPNDPLASAYRQFLSLVPQRQREAVQTAFEQQYADDVRDRVRRFFSETGTQTALALSGAAIVGYVGWKFLSRTGRRGRRR